MLNLETISPIQTNKPRLGNPRVAKSPNRATEPNFGSNKIFSAISQKLFCITSGVRALTPQEKEALRLEHQVFRPLDKFRGTPEAFTKKAYETLVDFYGLQSVKPPLVAGKGFSFSPIDYLNYDSSNIQKMGKGEIVSNLAHELDHFQKYGDVLCEIGLDEFQKQIIGTPQRFLENIRKSPSSAESILRRQDFLRDHLPSFERMDLGQLQKEIVGNPLAKWGTLQMLFPADADISGRSAILNKMRTFINAKPETATYILSQTMNRIDRPFWQNYLDKKRPSYTRKYDVAPFLKSFTDIHPESRAPYNYMLFMEEYLADPMEQTAWETGINMLKSWNKFKGLPANEHENKDPRIMLRFFEKVDKRMAQAVPNEPERIKFFDQTFTEVAEKMKKSGETPTSYKIIGQMARDLGLG